MKPEYDFSKAVRGKFFHKGAELRLPIYLDAKLPTRVERFVLQCFFPMPAKDGYPSICCVRKQVADFLLKVWSADQLFHFWGNPVSVLL